MTTCLTSAGQTPWHFQFWVGYRKWMIRRSNRITVRIALKRVYIRLGNRLWIQIPTEITTMNISKCIWFLLRLLEPSLVISYHLNCVQPPCLFNFRSGCGKFVWQSRPKRSRMKVHVINILQFSNENINSFLMYRQTLVEQPVLSSL